MLFKLIVDLSNWRLILNGHFFVFCLSVCLSADLSTPMQLSVFSMFWLEKLHASNSGRIPMDIFLCGNHSILSKGDNLHTVISIINQNKDSTDIIVWIQQTSTIVHTCSGCWTLCCLGSGRNRCVVHSSSGPGPNVANIHCTYILTNTRSYCQTQETTDKY